MRKILLILFIGIFLIGNVVALSNESIQAKNALIQSKADINEMQEREIPIKRVNETYEDALQIYNAQIALEEKFQGANYKLVFEYTEEISKIKDISIQAKDELKIFIENYEEAKKDSDLSGFEDEYNRVINSFNEERFEDTLVLIDEGYESLSEIQSSQTATRVFYLSTTQTIKSFFVNYWLHLLIGIIVTVIIILIFWNRLIKWRLKKKLKHLETQKHAVNGLVRKMQKNYFKTKNLSENEYRIKLKKYEELLRDVERKKMVIRGQLYKKEREEKISKKKSKPRTIEKSKPVKKKVVKKKNTRKKVTKKSKKKTNKRK